MPYVGTPSGDSLLAELSREHSLKMALEVTKRVDLRDPQTLVMLLSSIYLSAFMNGAVFAMVDIEYTGELLRAGEVSDMLPLAMSVAAEYMRNHPLMAPPADKV